MRRIAKYLIRHWNSKLNSAKHSKMAKRWQTRREVRKICYNIIESKLPFVLLIFSSPLICLSFVWLDYDLTATVDDAEYETIEFIIFYQTIGVTHTRTGFLTNDDFWVIQLLVQRNEQRRRHKDWTNFLSTRITEKSIALNIRNESNKKSDLLKVKSWWNWNIVPRCRHIHEPWATHEISQTFSLSNSRTFKTYYICHPTSAIQGMTMSDDW